MFRLVEKRQFKMSTGLNQFSVGSQGIAAYSHYNRRQRLETRCMTPCLLALRCCAESSYRELKGRHGPLLKAH